MSQPVSEPIALADCPALLLRCIKVSGGGRDVEAEAALQCHSEFVRLEALAGRKDVEPVAAVVAGARDEVAALALEEGGCAVGVVGNVNESAVGKKAAPEVVVIDLAQSPLGGYFECMPRKSASQVIILVR